MKTPKQIAEEILNESDNTPDDVDHETHKALKAHGLKHDDDSDGEYHSHRGVEHSKVHDHLTKAGYSHSGPHPFSKHNVEHHYWRDEKDGKTSHVSTFPRTKTGKIHYAQHTNQGITGFPDNVGEDEKL